MRFVANQVYAPLPAQPLVDGRRSRNLLVRRHDDVGLRCPDPVGARVLCQNLAYGLPVARQLRCPLDAAVYLAPKHVRRRQVEAEVGVGVLPRGGDRPAPTVFP
ncbi:MAG: hypothetical protein U5Q44_09265 [Dehalococcoidia bacterium]|nr:hypothetical protein [Dehalococcoidia bacterium]